MRRRNHVVYARFSDDEYEALLEKVRQTGQKMQSYIIHSSLSSRISSAEELDELKRQTLILEDMSEQLRGIGTNLNLLAHIADGQRIIPTTETLVRISNKVSQIKKEVDEKWLSTRQSISQQNLMEQ
jgi:hypothetical protein